MEEIKKAALRYLELGLSVIPLKPKSKNPYISSWKEFQNRRASLDEIQKWWEQPDLNIGIICGQVSNIVVVDIDKNDPEIIKSLKLPPTFIVKTGRGFHYYYRYPTGLKIPVIKCYWGEIRGNGGYVVGSPSIHVNGQIYEAISDLSSIDELPVLPAELLKRFGEMSKGNKYEQIVQGVAEGGRNNAAASYIGTIINKIDKDRWETTAWNLVLFWNSKNIPPLETAELRRTFESICSREVGKRESVPGFAEDKPIKHSNFTITKCSEMLTKEVEKFPYIIDRIVPEHAITAITADTGKGKSLFALFLAKAVAAGEKLFGEFEVKKNKVLFIDQEMDGDLIIGRFKSIITENIDIDYIYEQFWTINNEEDYEWLKNEIISQKYGLIIFDTLTTIHTLEENSADDMKKLNKLFLRLIKETGTTIIYLHHHRKQQSGEARNGSLSRGSTEITAKVASHLRLESKREGGFLEEKMILNMTLTQEKARRPESISTIGIKVTHDKKSKITTYDYQGMVEENFGQIEQAKNLIIKELEEDYPELTVRQVKEHSDIGLNSIRIAFKELVRKGVLDSRKAEHNTCYYFLRPQQVTTL